MTRTIDKKAEGKHIGHACEGHFRGIVRRVINGTGLSIARELPFSFHVNPDVVLLDNKGRVHTVFIVAFWNNSHNSESKYYRSRSEYTGVKSAITSNPNKFTISPVASVVLYGTPGGWKEKILNDLRTQCAPCFFLPDTFSNRDAAQLVAIAYRDYKRHWEKGKPGSREHVESVTATKPNLSPSECKLLELVESILSRKPKARVKSPKSIVTNNAAVRLPLSYIATRYRQPLGFLSVFPDSEIAAWKASSLSIIDSPAVSDYAIRAHFLGLGTISERKTIGRRLMVFQPSTAVRIVNGKSAYAPDLLDFENWEEIPDLTRISLLDSHRELTRHPGSVFKGGAFDQCIGNWMGICDEIISNTPDLIAAVGAADSRRIVKVLARSKSVGPESWHPAAAQAQFVPCWALAVAAVACILNDRAVRSSFGSRNQGSPSKADMTKLARELVRLSGSVSLLQDAVAFCRAITSRNLQSISLTKIPDLLSPDNPSSLIKDFYNTLTTNSSHNPLNTPVRKWLEDKYPGLNWHGWPAKRSISASDVLGVKTGRRQWQFIGLNPDGKEVVAAEVKSITANNWGNKSKELYDRVAETRAAAKTARMKLTCIGVLDGDFGKDEFAELSTGIGYDEVYSIKEILGIN